MKENDKAQEIEPKDQQVKAEQPLEEPADDYTEPENSNKPDSEEDIRKFPDIEAQILQLQQEKDVLYNRLLRQQADFENYRRRIQAEQKKWAEEAVSDFVQKLLPVIDNLERAMQAADSSNPLSKGVELVYRQVIQVFEQTGITRIESVGQPFDPNFHQAVQRDEQKDTPPDIILDEYQKGYIYNEKVIRPSMVKVSG